MKSLIINDNYQPNGGGVEFEKITYDRVNDKVWFETPMLSLEEPLYNYAYYTINNDDYYYILTNKMDLDNLYINGEKYIKNVKTKEILADDIILKSNNNTYNTYDIETFDSNYCITEEYINLFISPKNKEIKVKDLEYFGILHWKYDAYGNNNSGEYTCKLELKKISDYFIIDEENNKLIATDNLYIDTIIDSGDEEYDSLILIEDAELSDEYNDINGSVGNRIDTVIEYTKQHSFSSNQEYEIKFKFNENRIVHNSIVDYNLTKLIINENITSIGESAFYACESLTSIEIPSSVTSIGDYAFGGCDSLTSITCLATTAPNIYSSTFNNVASNGILKVPSGSNYSSWMFCDEYDTYEPIYGLDCYDWSIEYIHTS